MNVLNPADIGTALPIKVWEPEGKTVYADNDVYQQLRNLANHPLARKWVCAMPDYHLGYGMPIGGVLATRGGVVPNAVGVDIGCGMIAARTNIDIGGLDRDVLARLRTAIHGRLLWWGTEMLVGHSVTVIAYEERFAYYDRLDAWRLQHCNTGHENPFR